MSNPVMSNATLTKVMPGLKSLSPTKTMVPLKVLATWLFLFTVAMAPIAAQSAPCIVPDDGNGTTEIPPVGCVYVSPSETYTIVDGLPPGTTIELKPVHRDFDCGMSCGAPGGDLGGEVEDYSETLIFLATGTGELDGFKRVLFLPGSTQTQSAPRTPGDPVQTFDTDFSSYLAATAAGDPDFAVLQIVAGTSFGLSSPGQTTLTTLGNGTFMVDSFFDIAYQISFEGAPGGALEGLAGITAGTLRVEAAMERNPCSAPDSGTGTVMLPPDCEYRSLHSITDGLPGGTTLEISSRLTDFSCAVRGGAGSCAQAGGSLGGEVETFDGVAVLQIQGTGTLSDFRKTVRVPVSVETHSAPRTAGDSIQGFLTSLVDLDGALPAGDLDFSSLEIVAGSSNGLPSPGYMSLIDQGGSTYQVDSFFDIEYRISFAGAVGGALEGLSGTTSSETSLKIDKGLSGSVESDNGTGKITLPPPNSAYVRPHEALSLSDGLSAGTEIETTVKLSSFVCDPAPCSTSGGNLGGEIQNYTAIFEMDMLGTGSLAGFQRTLQIPVMVETHSAPTAGSVPGVVADAFHTRGSNDVEIELVAMGGLLPAGDEDFTELEITIETESVGPNPGSLSLTDLGDGTFGVDSFFDISYRIDFTGEKGGSLDGVSSTNRGTARLTADRDPGAQTRDITIAVIGVAHLSDDVAFAGDLGLFSLDDDSDATLSNERTFHNLAAGTFDITAATPMGWSLTEIQCVDPDLGSSVDLSMNLAQAELDLGESVRCTFRVVDDNVLFLDGFESGDTNAWSTVTP